MRCQCVSLYFFSLIFSTIKQIMRTYSNVSFNFSCDLIWSIFLIQIIIFYVLYLVKRHRRTDRHQIIRQSNKINIKKMHKYSIDNVCVSMSANVAFLELLKIYYPFSHSFFISVTTLFLRWILNLRTMKSKLHMLSF